MGGIVEIRRRRHRGRREVEPERARARTARAEPAERARAAGSASGSRSSCRRRGTPGERRASAGTAGSSSTPPTSVSASAARSFAIASSRVGAVGDQLRDHRVVARPDRVALVHPTIDADRARQPEPLDATRSAAGSVRGSSAYSRTSIAWPARRAVRLELVALGDPDLLGDQIEAGHRLGHRVLDLDPRVQLEEEELAPGDHELGRAGAAVVDRIGEPERRLAELEPERRIDHGRRRLLEHLLVPALDRAFALRKRDPMTVAVPKELHLDVTRRLDVALEEDRVVAERRLRLAPGRLERRLRARPPSARPASRVRRRPPPP